MHYHHMAEAAEVGVELGSADLTGVSPTFLLVMPCIGARAGASKGPSRASLAMLAVWGSNESPLGPNY